MNTSLRGQARFPTVLLPLIRPFQISIHGIGTVMNKKMSFKFNRTKPARDRNGGKFCACRAQSSQQLAIMQNTSLEINGGGRQMEYSSLIECALLSPARCKGRERSLQYHLPLKQSITVSDPLGNQPIRLMIYGCPRGAVGAPQACGRVVSRTGPNPFGTGFIIITPLNFNPSSSSFPYILIGVRRR